MRACTLCTSLSPREGARSAQNLALESWRARGWRVISVNRQEEAEILRQNYASLAEIRTFGRSTPEKGRALVPVAELIRLGLKENHGQYAVILNADIQLAHSGPAEELLPRAGPGLTMIRRWEVGGPGDPAEGVPNPWGWDGAVIRAALADVFRNPKFLLGLPWWDYWLPSKALHLGFPVRCWEGRIALHPRHPELWSEHDRAILGAEILREIGVGPWRRIWRRFLGPKAMRKIYGYHNHLAGHVRTLVNTRAEKMDLLG